MTKKKKQDEEQEKHFFSVCLFFSPLTLVRMFNYKNLLYSCPLCIFSKVAADGYQGREGGREGRGEGQGTRVFFLSCFTAFPLPPRQRQGGRGGWKKGVLRQRIFSPPFCRRDGAPLVLIGTKNMLRLLVVVVVVVVVCEKKERKEQRKKNLFSEARARDAQSRASLPDANAADATAGLCL